MVALAGHHTQIARNPAGRRGGVRNPTRRATDEEMKTMPLYRITSDGEPEYFEAVGFRAAYDLWRAHIDETNPEHDMSDFEPDNVELLSSDPVIRKAPMTEMTVRLAQARVNEIKEYAVTCDPEAAHQLEDRLLVAFIRSIEMGGGPAGEVARVVLSSADIQFARWTS